ncbi:MAG: Arc family DNA-binding protein [Sedimenticola sp.]
MADRHQITPFPTRMSGDLKKYLKHCAGGNYRSLNSEIVARLEESRKRDQANEQQK